MTHYACTVAARDSLTIATPQDLLLMAVMLTVVAVLLTVMMRRLER